MLPDSSATHVPRLLMEFMDLLADPRLQGISAIAAIISALALVLFARRRRLSWGYTRLPVVSVASAVRDQLTVQYRGAPIDSAWIVSLTVVNTGSAAIPRADFDIPVSIHFADGVRILSADIEAAQPADLPVVLRRGIFLEGGKDLVTIEPLLLNPGDGFKLALVVSGAPGEPKPVFAARISGVKALGDFDGDTWPLYLKLTQSLVASLTVFPLLYALVVLVPEYVKNWGVTVLGALFALVVFVLAYGLVSLVFSRFLDPYGRLRRR